MSTIFASSSRSIETSEYLQHIVQKKVCSGLDEAHVIPILHFVINIICDDRRDIRLKINLLEQSGSKRRERKLSNKAIFKRNEAEALSTRKEKIKFSFFNFSTFSAFYFILCCVEYFFILFSHFLFYNSPIVQSVAGFGCDKT